MSEVSLLYPKAEVIGEIVRDFAREGRALLDTVLHQENDAARLIDWYREFNSGVDGKLGVIVMMFANSSPDINRELPQNVGRGFLIGPAIYPFQWQYCRQDYTAYPIRSRIQRGIVGGVRFEQRDVGSTTITNSMKLRDYPNENVSVSVHAYHPDFRNYTKIINIGRNRIDRGGLTVTDAFDIALSFIESMPGVGARNDFVRTPSQVIDIGS